MVMKRAKKRPGEHWKSPSPISRKAGRPCSALCPRVTTRTVLSGAMARNGSCLMRIPYLSPITCSGFDYKSGTGTATRENRALFLDRILPAPGRNARAADCASYCWRKPLQSHKLDIDRDQQAAAGQAVRYTARRPGLPRPRLQREKTGDISAIIAYILNKPELAMLVEEPGELSGLSVPGMDFLTTTRHPGPHKPRNNLRGHT